MRLSDPGGCPHPGSIFLIREKRHLFIKQERRTPFGIRHFLLFSWPSVLDLVSEPVTLHWPSRSRQAEYPPWRIPALA